MNKKFEFESRNIPNQSCPDYNAELEVEIRIECRDQDGADATFDVEWIALKGSDIPLKLEQLSPEDQVYLERIAQDYADELGHEAYHDWQVGRADAAYDAWKDQQMEDSES